MALAVVARNSEYPRPTAAGLAVFIVFHVFIVTDGSIGSGWFALIVYIWLGTFKLRHDRIVVGAGSVDDCAFDELHALEDDMIVAFVFRRSWGILLDFFEMLA